MITQVWLFLRMKINNDNIIPKLNTGQDLFPRKMRGE